MCRSYIFRLPIKKKIPFILSTGPKGIKVKVIHPFDLFELPEKLTTTHLTMIFIFSRVLGRWSRLPACRIQAAVARSSRISSFLGKTDKLKKNVYFYFHCIPPIFFKILLLLLLLRVCFKKFYTP